MFAPVYRHVTRCVVIPSAGIPRQATSPVLRLCSQRNTFRTASRAAEQGSYGRFKYSHIRWPTALLVALAVPLHQVLNSDVKAEEQFAAGLTKSETPQAQEQQAEQKQVEREHNIFWRILYFFRDYVIEPLSTARRFCYLAFIFIPVLATAPVLLLDYSKHGKPERWTTIWWYRFLVRQMERAGPTFIKLAQWAGSRRDLFPESLCQMFGRLHSGGKPHSLKHTRSQLENSFGKTFEEIFSDFNEEPLGIGAVAQVYRATLNPDLVPRQYLGPKHEADPSPKSRVARTILPSPEDYAPENIPSTSLAIKILHPKVEKNIYRDLKIMSFFASALNLIPGVQWLSLPEEVEVFGALMMMQLDLRTESSNLRRFEKNFRHKRTISFPRPLSDYTTKEVLIEEYQDAVPLKYFLSAGGGPYDERIATLGMDAFLKMLLVDNFVHSDLHPGNIMIKFYKPTTRSWYQHFFANLFDRYEPEPATVVQPGDPTAIEIARHLRNIAKEQTKWHGELERLDNEGYQPELVFIDTGLVTELSQKNLKNFLELFTAIAQFDGYRAGQLMVERCRSPEAVIDEETFALKMQRLVLSVKSQTFSLGKIRISDVLSEVLQNVRTHHVKMEPDFVNTVISVLLLEGIGRQLDPNMDLFANALPVLRQVGMQIQTSAIDSHGLDFNTVGQLAKVWLYMEAKNLISLATVEIDDMVLFDELTPSI